jgi:uncharacterized repeat protein (TIGR01451 family)
VKKKVLIGIIILLHFAHYSRAQYTFQPLANAIDRIHIMQGVGDSLYGFAITDSSWQIGLRDGDVWRFCKPIRLNGDVPIKVDHFQGDLFALTSTRLLRYSDAKWDVIVTSSFKEMATYRNRLILNGSFLSINGYLANGLAYYDGTQVAPLMVNNQPAHITGTVYQMTVIDGKLFFCGQLFNTNFGPTPSRVVTWNDTTFSSPFNPVVNNPWVQHIVKHNGNLYIQGYSFPNNKSGVWKIVGQQPVSLDSVESGFMFSNLNNFPVYGLTSAGGRLYGFTELMDTIVDQWGNISLSYYRALVYFNGLYWKMEQKLNNGGFVATYPWPSNLTSYLPRIFNHNGKLHSWLVTDNPAHYSYVWVRDSGYAATSLLVIDNRKQFCHPANAKRYIPVKVDVNNGADVFFSSKSGPISIELPVNQPTTLKVSGGQLPYYTIKNCSDSIITVDPLDSNLYRPEFHFEPIGNISDVACNIIGQTGWRARHGFYEDFYITVKNKGTDSIQNINLSFNYPAQSTYHNSSIPAQSTNTGASTYSISALAAGEEIIIRVKLHNTTSLSIGDSIDFIANVSIAVNDANTANNTAVLTQQVVAAYDPNNKLVSWEKVSQWGGRLSYQINFQNLGNDTAWRVIVVDTLPAQVKPTTFEFVGSSHSVEYVMQNGIVHFIFDNIRLADSASSAEASKGHVQFSIEMEDQLAITDSIKNRAHIFFDFQPAVITNFAVTAHAENVGIKELPLSHIYLYPNPNKGILRVLAEEQAHISVFNNLGQEVWSGNLEANVETQINLFHLPNGVYFIKSKSGVVEKIVIQH